MNINMNFVGFILEHAAKILDHTHDAYEASILRELADFLSKFF